MLLKLLKSLFREVTRPAPRRISFHLYIEYHEFYKYYAGEASTVRTIADDGQSIMFPAAKLRPFLTHKGIRGHFIITYDHNNKFLNLERV